MYKDTDFVSRQSHELNYILQRYGLPPDAAHRRRLLALLDDFHAAADYAPHHRADFYRYLEQHLGPAVGAAA